ncbi:lactate dehydrogenase [Reticulibacter mediterranei]|uniref:Lactate dehydrogenase n=1 Tax=Reticulibacter mediterranei TaxID=2778369 RepID=A0A8J3MY43_9CHLR|nr:NAD(P)-dependent oxidoreductase [Reticulibacter mediterranei]GHO91614.1 lactate dehydrogenase [Reticulibacter mediterranei]
MEKTLVKALATAVNDEEGHYLAQALQGIVELQQISGSLNDVDPHDLAEIVVLMPFIHERIGHAEIEKMPQLKLIATRSTGYDHIDLAAAAQHGIAVANVPGYGETAVAEQTFALVLTLSRKMHLAYTRTQQGDYSIEGLRGFDLYGKTLGVVGAGAIGLHVIRIAKGFGMNVVAYDVNQNRLLAEVLGFRYVKLDELFTISDIITLHAPALPSTQHMINRETLSTMKHGALLINTARGSLIDTQALVWALDTGILAGAGLDALEGEEFLQHEEELLNTPDTEDKLKILAHNRLLQRRDNVVITPHIAFNTEEALRRILDTTIENVQAFLQGHPSNLVKR